MHGRTLMNFSPAPNEMNIYVVIDISTDNGINFHENEFAG